VEEAMNDTTPQPQGVVALQPRRAGELLRAALDHYQRHPWTLIALIAVWVFPMGILNWQAHCGRSRSCRITVLDGVVVSTSWSATTAWVVGILLALAVVGVLLAVTIRVIAVRLADEDAGLRQALDSGRARPGSPRQVAVLVLGAPAVLTLLFLPGIYLATLEGPAPQLAMTANILLAAVAGLYVGVRLAVSVPAAVVEGRRWPQALSRSWSLVAGHWSHVLATLLLALLATGLVGTLLGLLLVPVGSLLEAMTEWSVTDGWLARTLIQAAVNALTLPYLLVVWVLLYLDLRARAERLDLDTLSADLAARLAQRKGLDR
jgi:hypothetical protein